MNDESPVRQLRKKIADAVQELVNAKVAAHSSDCDDPECDGHRAAMVTNCIVLYESVIVRDDGTPGYSITYSTLHDGPVSSDAGVLEVGYRDMMRDITGSCGD